MSLAQEWESLKTLPKKDVKPSPEIGAKAPTHPNLTLPIDKPTIIAFLRHCGCPFAEKTFKSLAKLSNDYKDINFVAVSHSSSEATERWVVKVGGNWDVSVVIDEERDLYSLFGLGLSTTWHLMNPISLYNTLQLGKKENIWNRPTESGSRWQMSGAFAIDERGYVRWKSIAARSDDMPKWDAAIQSVGVTPKPKPPPPVQTHGFL
ncbi:hypothetical protein F5B22DRAFT_586571 [Xylaria bambusicola]|uniref:uncharacterized protein n=1 Tax=Xylaria bambusicola TaxID=326684 RepID=UPI0020083E5C|nr:uncharacterized protein F5B22DRAFT_586571 [Xylaria bambusicola]KAI0526592.1 hypothetical protein F5B22DRAFT_586571 [Xylaria bambusicola]